MNDEPRNEYLRKVGSVFEKYGETMYCAQILESDMQIVVSRLEKSGVIHIDRVKYQVEEDKHGVMLACIGPMVSWIKGATSVTFPPDFVKQLKKANMQRNRLAHTFLLENSTELMSMKGCDNVLQKLHRILANLSNVGDSVKKIRNFLYAQYGYAEEVMDQITKNEIDEARARD